MGYYYNQTHNSDFKITLREVLLSTVILAVMIGLGVFISGKIQDKRNRKVRDITSSVQITTSSEFDYSIRTDIGKFIAEGELVAEDSVSIQDISGYYMYIKKAKEKYTRHVQVYTTSDGKGHVRSHTRVYYSWDVVHVDKFYSKNLTFLGQSVEVDFPASRYHSTINENSIIRYKYYTVPTHVSGTILGKIENHSIQCHFSEASTIESVITQSKKNINTPVTIFWIFWALLILGLIGLFYWGEYEWLERN